MKYIKLYEEDIFEKELQIGDYVVCKDEWYSSEGMMNFISDNIGQYVQMNYHYSDDYIYMIRYSKIPLYLQEYFKDYTNHQGTKRCCRAMRKSEIIFFSSNKKDCEAFITANKYNL